MSKKNKIKEWFKVTENQILLIIFFFALLIRLKYAFISGLWWDEARYAEFGREILHHPLSYSAIIEGGGQITNYEPLLPYLLAFSQFIFGEGDFAVRIVNPILGAIAVIAIYYLGSLLFNRKIGLIAAVLLSVSPILWFNNLRILLETPELTFITSAFALFIYGYERKNKKILYLSGAVMALAYLSRISAGFIPIIIILYLFATEKTKWIKNKNIWILALVGILVLTPWMIRNLGVCDFPLCEIKRGASAISPIPQEEGAFQFELFTWAKQFPSLLTLPIFLFFIFGLILAFQTKKKGDMFTLIWLFVFLLVMTQIGGLGGAQLRRILILVPPMILLASKAIYTISEQLKMKNIPSYFIILIIILPLMYFSIYGGFGSDGGKDLIISKAPAFSKLKDAGLYLKDTSEDTKILANSLNQIAFYSGGKNTTNYFPENPEDLSKTLKEHDYDYIVIDGYEIATAPQWLFSFNQPEYLETPHIITQDNQQVAYIFKVNKEKL